MMMMMKTVRLAAQIERMWTRAGKREEETCFATVRNFSVGGTAEEVPAVFEICPVVYRQNELEEVWCRARERVLQRSSQKKEKTSSFNPSRAAIADRASSRWTTRTIPQPE